MKRMPISRGMRLKAKPPHYDELTKQFYDRIVWKLPNSFMSTGPLIPHDAASVLAHMLVMDGVLEWGGEPDGFITIGCENEELAALGYSTFEQKSIFKSLASNEFIDLFSEDGDPWVFNINLGMMDRELKARDKIHNDDFSDIFPDSKRSRP